MSERASSSTYVSSSPSGSYSQQPSSSREVGRARLPERVALNNRVRVRPEPDAVDEQPPSKKRTSASAGNDRGFRGSRPAALSISNPNTPRNGSPPGASDDGASDDLPQNSKAASKRGYSAAMAADPIFHMFPEPGEQHDREVYNIISENNISESDRFIQKQYPMLYMNLTAHEHPAIVDVQYENDGTDCPLCQVDRNTLDSIKVLKAHEVKGYLDSYNHRFTEEQVNIHLAHTMRDENVIGVIQNMSVDLMSKSYSLANVASLRILNRIQTHMGRPFFVPDQDVAKVHNDAVKQFIGLASTCQALMKYKHSDNERLPATNPLL